MEKNIKLPAPAIRGIETFNLPKPATRIVVERKNWAALAPIIEGWLEHYPSLKTITPAIIHAALTCYLSDAADTAAYDYSDDEKPSRRMTVEAYNDFIQILLGRQFGSHYQSPAEGGIFVDEDGVRVVWFASYMQAREIQVRETSYGWKAEFFFGEGGSTRTANFLFEATVNSDYGYAVAYGKDGAVIVHSNFLLNAREPRKGELWFSYSKKMAAEELLNYLGNSAPEVSKALLSAMLERALLDQQAAKARLPYKTNN